MNIRLAYVNHTSIDSKVNPKQRNKYEPQGGGVGGGSGNICLNPQEDI